MSDLLKPQSSDERAVITEAQQALVRLQSLLLRNGHLSNQPLPDRIELLHAIPPFTQAVEVILSSEGLQLNPQPNPTPGNKPRP